MNPAGGDIEKNKFQIVFVLGGPGSGKGTQCANISRDFGYVHLSAGELLRIEMEEPQSKYGEEIKKHMQEGTIVPVEITCSLLEQEMIKTKKHKFLIDGFPRNQNNLDGWHKQMSSKVEVQFVLFIDCTDDICVQRCLGRGTGRADDNQETLKKRLVVFRDQCKPIIDHFSKKGLVFKVDGDMSAEEVFNKIKEKFNSLH